MGGGGSGSGANVGGATNANIDPTALANWIASTQQGQQFQGQYANLMNKNFSGGQPVQFSNTPNGIFATGEGADNGGASGVDVSAMINAFNSYNTDQANAQSTWQNYATLVQQQGGGEGAQTIIGSPAAQTLIGGGGPTATANRMVGRP